MKKLKSMIRAVLASAVLLCVVGGCAYGNGDAKEQATDRVRVVIKTEYSQDFNIRRFETWDFEWDNVERIVYMYDDDQTDSIRVYLRKHGAAQTAEAVKRFKKLDFVETALYDVPKPDVTGEGIGAYAALLLERNEYSEENRNKIESIKAEGEKSVQQCNSQAEIEKAVNDARYRMDVVEPSESLGENVTATLTSLKSAFEGGFITKWDVEQIKYYHDYQENKPTYPRPIGAQAEQAIKEAQADYYRTHYARDPEEAAKVEANGFRIVEYYGNYNGYYVYSINSMYWNYPEVPVDYWRDMCGVEFHFGEHYGISVCKIV